jgi:MFS family permease
MNGSQNTTLTNPVASFVQDYMARTREFGRNANLYVLHVIGMDMIHGSFNVLFNLYLLALGFDVRFVGLRLTIGFVASAITAVPAGLVSDRIGRLRHSVPDNGDVLPGLDADLLALLPAYRS